MVGTVYTIGHSNSDSYRFLKLLRDVGIETVVDIRSNPYSSYVPHFDKPALERLFKQERLGYIYLGDVLGGKPDDPECYDSNGKPVYSKIAEKSGYKKGISTLLKIVSSSKTALLCSEENPQSCHRHLLVSQSLMSAGVKVLHIRGTGAIEEAKKGSIQMSLF